jgi:hypothetical protein
MNRKKWIHRGIALTLSAALVTGIAPPPAVAKTSTEKIIGAVIGGAVAANEMNAQIKYYNTTEEGRQALFEELQEKYGVYYRYDLNSQLDRIFANLTAAIGSMDETVYDRPYNYFINREDSFNAFCTLGHNMSVNVGLYSYLSNEDEIAVVLAHEMGHGQKDHPAKGMKRSLGPAILASATGSVLGAIAANIWSGQGLTKPMEWEADNLAFEYIARSPYNPGATAAVWQRLIDLTGNNAADAFSVMTGAADHPSNAARRDNYAKKLTTMSGGKVTVEEGVVYVNKKKLLIPAVAGGMSSAERAYFVMGNLAAAYKNGHAAKDAYVDGRTIMLGAQPIVSCTGNDADPAEIAALLNRIK